MQAGRQTEIHTETLVAILRTFITDNSKTTSSCSAQEPPTNTALLQHPLVTSTPHLGASTIDAQTRVAVDIAQQFIAFTRQTALTGAVSASINQSCLY